MRGRKGGNAPCHKIIKHAFEYVHGEIHTNSIEGFWALFKRGIIGLQVKIELYDFNYYSQYWLRITSTPY